MLSCAESSEAIRKLQALGFDGAVLTPHVRKHYYENKSQDLGLRLQELKDYLKAEEVDFQLYLAAEYYVDEHFLELIQKQDLLTVTMGNEQFILVEFDVFQDSPMLKVCLSALVARGYRPVIAHVERYAFVAKDRDAWLAYFKTCNAVLQCDLGALVGQHGSVAKKFASWLKAHAEIGLWGTDLHHIEQIEKFIAPSLAALAPKGSLNKILNSICVGADP